MIFFFSSRRRHTRCLSDWSSDVCSSDLKPAVEPRKSPTGKTERRAIVGELRAKGRRLEGYAATFGAEARIGNFTETIAPRSEERRVGKECRSRWGRGE